MADFRTRLKSITSPIIIGIAGDSGSGKTTYSNGIRRLLGTDIVQTITMDGYHKENRTQRLASGILPLDPNANHLELLKEHITLLKQGKPAEIHMYNHISGDFDTPVAFTPSPIIILEGLHALYPMFLPLLDFTIYVDPSRQVKWAWKYNRDTKDRGHETVLLTEEMHRREMAYKRWIDFQKTDANIVIKINKSSIDEMALYEPLVPLSFSNYKVTLIMEPATTPLPTITLPFDLAHVLEIDKQPFMLAAIPSLYWGKKTTAVYIDGTLSQETVVTLENHIASLTNIPVDNVIKTPQTSELGLETELSAVQFAQLLIAWRFLEAVEKRLSP
jgi:phosphoribulokinase